MLTIGNVVRVNTSRCIELCPKCKARSDHRKYHDRRGILAGNIREDPPPFTHLICFQCRESAYELATTEHIWVVAFDNIGYLYLEEELIDLGGPTIEIDTNTWLELLVSVPVPEEEKIEELVTA